MAENVINNCYEDEVMPSVGLVQFMLPSKLIKCALRCPF